MLTMRGVVGALAALLIAVPAAAQFSDTYNFFKHVKARKAFEAVKIISEAGSAVVNLKDPDSGDTALVMVARDRDLGWMRLLLSKGADPNARARDGETPLTITANLGFVEGVQLLTDVGARIDLQNSRGETPLIKAVQARSLQTVRVLVEAGANPDKSDSIAGKSARDYAQEDRRLAAIAKAIKDGPQKVEPANAPASLPAGPSKP